MNRLRISLYAFAATLMLISVSACYEDKGNYDYIDLVEVRIDTTGTGIQREYSIQRYDELSLAPNVYFNGRLATDNDPLDYVWTLYAVTTSAITDYTVDTLATTRVLNAPITRKAESYALQLTVKNREDNTETYFTTSVRVDEVIAGGWVVLYESAEAPGMSDVGVIMNPLVKRNIIQNREFWDLYTASNGQHLDGKPVRVQKTVVSIADDPITIVTDKEIVLVNNASFVTSYTFDDFFFDAPDNHKIQYYGNVGMMSRGELLINDNKVYTTSWNALSRSNSFGVGSTGNYGELAPWASDIKGVNFNSVVYDQTNQRFIKQNYSTLELSAFAAQEEDAAFDVNNVGGTLLMGDWGMGASVNMPYDYNIFSNGNERFLTISNFVNTNASTTRVGMNKYDISDSPGIQQATCMAAASLGQYVLYGSGNSVYNLQYNRSTTADTYWTAPSSGEEVTCIRLQKFYFFTLQSAMLPNPNAVVHIATWNEATKEGKLYQYQINPASGALMGEPYVYTVPGKVKDMGWNAIMGG
ncbi:MAG: hypothetical protein IJ604_08410 [Prevotella sp.]|nr:hypothetical protein [Prevotella sp.]